MEKETAKNIKLDKSDNNKYDIINEKKEDLERKKKEQKDFNQISKNIMSNKNRKLLKTI